MRNPITELGSTALEYLERFPEMPTRTLAKLMFEETKIYKSVEHARQLLRTWRGASGTDRRTRTTIKKFYKLDNIKASLPTSDATEYKLFHIPNGLRKGLILGDIHLPFHDLKALAFAIDAGNHEDVDFIILNGDIMDCYQLSNFIKDPTCRSFKDEIKITKEFLAFLRKVFPKAYILYKYANHEERLYTYLKCHANQLFSVDQFKFENLLDLRKYGISYVGAKRIIQIGKLSLLHGDEYSRGQTTPIGPARVLFMKSHDVAACGHWHRTSEYTERTIMDKTITCWSIGCLCDLHPEYARLNNWNHGYAIIELDKGGKFSMRNHRIGYDHDGTMLRF